MKAIPGRGRAAVSARIPGSVSGEHRGGCSCRENILPHPPTSSSFPVLPHPSVPWLWDVGMGSPRLLPRGYLCWAGRWRCSSCLSQCAFFSFPAFKQANKRPWSFPAAVDSLSFKSHCINFLDSFLNTPSSCNQIQLGQGGYFSD